MPCTLERDRQVVVEAEDRVGLVGGQHGRVVLAGDQLDLRLVDVVVAQEGVERRGVGAGDGDAGADQRLRRDEVLLGQREQRRRALLVLHPDDRQPGTLHVGAGHAVTAGDVHQHGAAHGLGVAGDVRAAEPERDVEALVLVVAAVDGEVAAAELHAGRPRQLQRRSASRSPGAAVPADPVVAVPVAPVVPAGPVVALPPSSSSSPQAARNDGPTASAPAPTSAVRNRRRRVGPSRSGSDGSRWSSSCSRPPVFTARDATLMCINIGGRPADPAVGLFPVRELMTPSHEREHVAGDGVALAEAVRRAGPRTPPCLRAVAGTRVAGVAHRVDTRRNGPASAPVRWRAASGSRGRSRHRPAATRSAPRRRTGGVDVRHGLAAGSAPAVSIVVPVAENSTGRVPRRRVRAGHDAQRGGLADVVEGDPDREERSVEAVVRLVLVPRAGRRRAGLAGEPLVLDEHDGVLVEQRAAQSTSGERGSAAWRSGSSPHRNRSLSTRGRPGGDSTP